MSLLEVKVLDFLNTRYDKIIFLEQVLLFSWDLTNYKNITASEQIGSYFGYSVTAADVNGDGRLDIVVGAPMHTVTNNEGKYDVGRVYVFYQNSSFVSICGSFIRVKIYMVNYKGSSNISSKLITKYFYLVTIFSLDNLNCLAFRNNVHFGSTLF